MKTKLAFLLGIFSLVALSFNPKVFAVTELPSGSYINISTSEVAPYTVRYEELNYPQAETSSDISDDFSINGLAFFACFVGTDCTPSTTNTKYNFQLSYESGELTLEFLPSGVANPQLNLGSGEFSLNSNSSVVVEIADATITIGNNSNPSGNVSVGAAPVDYSMLGPLEIRFNSTGGDGINPPAEDDDNTPPPGGDPDQGDDGFVDFGDNSSGCQLNAMANSTNISGYLAWIMFALGTLSFRMKK